MNNVDIMVKNMTCTGCGQCIPLCPNGFITIKQGELGFPVPSILKCDNCGNCIRGCPFANLLNDDE